MTDHKTGGISENLRAIVLEILLEVNEKGQHSNLVLKEVLDKYAYLPKRDRAFITRLTEGTLEYRIRLDYVIDLFSKVPVKKQKPVIREILRSSVYQILFMDSVPVPAVCNEAVKLAAKKGFYGLKGFVNGVLRTVARKAGEIDYPSEREEPVKALSVFYSMPEWIVEDFLKEYPYDKVKCMLESFLQTTAVSVRCQLSKGNAGECEELLRKEHVTVDRHPYLPYALQISGYDRLDGLSAFRQGRVAVQDVSSMLVAEIAAPGHGDVVLDVCAAPGGKSLHMADMMKGSGCVYARDISAYKASLIRENQMRLGTENVIIQVQDACLPDEGFYEKADVLLADVPCSGLGVLGKKKEIKYRMSREQQKELVQLQRQILDTVWRYVKPGGVLVYSTCTINKEENQDNLQWFLQKYPFEAEDIRPYLCEELKKEPGTEKGFIRLLPGVHKCDGFFIARMRRKMTGERE